MYVPSLNASSGSKLSPDPLHLPALPRSTEKTREVSATVEDKP